MNGCIRRLHVEMFHYAQHDGVAKGPVSRVSEGVALPFR
jgi:hypothetical protein